MKFDRPFSWESYFTRLREQMNAPFKQFIPETVVHKGPDFSDIDVRGIDVEIEDVDVADDGTFDLHGQKVIIYIRDQQAYVESYSGNATSGYRFHIGDCPTIASMKRQGRYYRYVATTRKDGLFVVNLKQPGKTKNDMEMALQVCKNCLRRVNYDGYRNRSQERKEVIWKSFSLKEFFNKYSPDFSEIPVHTENTAPEDKYPDNWDEISRAYRSKVGWKCEKCRIDLSAEHHFLDVHHKRAKSDNRDKDLIALCVECHARESGHGHMKQDPRYAEFRQWKREDSR